METATVNEAPGGLAAFGGDPRRAIQEDAIICLVCGGPFRQLNNFHLRLHGLTAEAYKQQFGYNLGRPLMCGALKRLYVQRAIQVGLAAAIRHRPILAQPELRRRGGIRPLALEELLTRREIRLARRTGREP